MSEFTSGTWEMHQNSNGTFSITSKDKVIAEVFTFDSNDAQLSFFKSFREEAANARIISAAPEMYAFVRNVYEHFSNPEDDEDDEFAGISSSIISHEAEQLLDFIDGND